MDWIGLTPCASLDLLSIASGLILCICECLGSKEFILVYIAVESATCINLSELSCITVMWQQRTQGRLLAPIQLV